MDSLFSTQLIHSQVQHIVEEEKDTGARGKSFQLLGDCLTVFGFHFGVDSISKEVAGFSPFMVSLRKKTCVHCLLCLIVVHFILSVKDLNVFLA